MSEKSVDPWKVRGFEFPVEQVLSVRLECLVRYAVLAPSTHNSQPWLFRVRGDALELFRRSNEIVTSVRSQQPRVDDFLRCSATVRPARGARLQPRGSSRTYARCREPRSARASAPRALHPPTSAEVRRFQAIPNRHTTRKSFTTDPLVDQHVAELSTLASRHSVTITLTSDPTMRNEVAALVAHADRRLMADPAFRRELSKWVRTKNASGAGGSAKRLPAKSRKLGDNFGQYIENLKSLQIQYISGSPCWIRFATFSQCPAARRGGSFRSFAPCTR